MVQWLRLLQHVLTLNVEKKQHGLVNLISLGQKLRPATCCSVLASLWQVPQQPKFSECYSTWE